MTYTPDFGGAIAKFYWAQHHRDSLDRELRQRGGDNRKRVTIRAKFNRKTGRYDVRVAALPVDFLSVLGLILGDAVHNLRGALDHVAWQLALQHTGGSKPADPDSIQFPIRDYAKALSAKVSPTGRYRPGFKKAAVLSHIDKSHWATLASFQPYKRGDGYWLALLRDMSNEDKHRTLTPFALQTSHWTPFTPVEIGLFDGRDLATRLKVGAKIMQMGPREVDLAPEDYVDMETYMTPAIRLDNRREPVETLDRISEVVCVILQAFGSGSLNFRGQARDSIDAR